MKVDAKYEQLNIRVDSNERRLASLGATLQVVTYLADTLTMIHIIPVTDPDEILELMPPQGSGPKLRRYERMISHVVQRSIAGDLYANIYTGVLARDTSSSLSIHNSGIQPIPGEITNREVLEQGLPPHGIQIILEGNCILV